MRSVPRVQILACCSLLSLSACARCGREPAKDGSTPAAQPEARAGAQGASPAASGAGSSAVAPAGARETILAELPAGNVTEVAIAEDGSSAAYAVQEGSAIRVFHGDRVSPAYPQVAKVVLSPDGRHLAFQAQRDGAWRMSVDGTEGPPFQEVSEPLFSPDGAHVVYQGRDGGGWRIVTDGAVRGAAAAEVPYERLAVVGGSRLLFLQGAVRGWGKLVVSDLALASPTVVDAAAAAPLVSADRARVAAISSDAGGQRAITFTVDRPERVDRGPSRDGIYNLNFGPDGATLAYVAERGGRFSVVLEGKEEPVPEGEELITAPVVQPGNRAALAGVITQGSVECREFFGGTREGPWKHVDSVVYAPDGRGHAYAAEKGDAGLVVVNGHEGPPFDKVVTPAFSPDGRFVVYRARKDGKRFVVVADAAGRTVRQGAEFEQVFPVLFTEDGKAIAYGVKDGRRLLWRVEPL